MKSHATILLLAGLATSASASAREPERAADPVADRSAILAMLGEYDVDFAFDETVLLAPGYERAPAQRSGGSEVVILVEDAARADGTPHRIVLQHILVDPKSGHVTKHWRQDWTWEAKQRFEFSADQTWRVRPLAPEKTRGAWTQCVYEVSDAPRYCGTGRWNHRYGVATWTSDRTWRPLPRREYTKREDYNAMNVENRHTIVPGGWTHEQDNTKAVRAADGSTVRTIAREYGFNDYRSDTDVDFTPALDYWKATAGYWERVRARWDAFLEDGRGLRLKTKIDGMALIIPLFTQAAGVEEGRPVPDADIDAAFAEWVEAPPAGD
ncbi:hypothetical protein H9645_11170 [Luteimonas sp. Sa2BVA3]|uniref:Secreted protein n=1 Tax=Luteimonas colneyensis TaxID=2762230 RepID=A0ABR8UKL9_9GAMM|nr:DUF6607 family protein [Luteimonas colneyensis]MBD7988584.1 hypothetical protein [Luteimonas colneyensis]